MRAGLYGGRDGCGQAGTVRGGLSPVFHQEPDARPLRVKGLPGGQEEPYRGLGHAHLAGG